MDIFGSSSDSEDLAESSDIGGEEKIWAADLALGSSVVTVVINVAPSVSAGGSSSSVECESAKVFGSHSFFTRVFPTTKGAGCPGCP